MGAMDGTSQLDPCRESPLSQIDAGMVNLLHDYLAPTYALEMVGHHGSLHCEVDGMPRCSAAHHTSSAV